MVSKSPHIVDLPRQGEARLVLYDIKFAAGRAPHVDVAHMQTTTLVHKKEGQNGYKRPCERATQRSGTATVVKLSKGSEGRACRVTFHT